MYQLTALLISMICPSIFLHIIIYARPYRRRRPSSLVVSSAIANLAPRKNSRKSQIANRRVIIAAVAVNLIQDSRQPLCDIRWPVAVRTLIRLLSPSTSGISENSLSQLFVAGLSGFATDAVCEMCLSTTSATASWPGAGSVEGEAILPG